MYLLLYFFGAALKTFCMRAGMLAYLHMCVCVWFRKGVTLYQNFCEAISKVYMLRSHNVIFLVEKALIFYF